MKEKNKRMTEAAFGLIFSLVWGVFCCLSAQEETALPQSMEPEKHEILAADIQRIYNGRFVDEDLEVRVFPSDGGEFRGELIFGGVSWQFEGICAMDKLVCGAWKEGEDMMGTIPLQIKRQAEEVQTGGMTVQWRDHLYHLKEVPLPEINGYYIGDAIVLHIEKGEEAYEGELEMRRNAYESRSYPLTGEALGGRILGKCYDPLKSGEELDFELKEKSGKMSLKIENHLISLEPAAETLLMRKALAAKSEKRWADAIVEAEAIIRQNRYYLSEAVSLQRESDQALSNERTVRKHIKRAEEFVEDGIWDRVKKEADSALKLDPENETALKLSKQAAEKLHNIELRRTALRSDLDEIATSRQNEDWTRVIKTAERVLALDPCNQQALRFKEEAEIKIEELSQREPIPTNNGKQSIRQSDTFKAVEAKFIKENFHYLEGEYQGDHLVLKIRRDEPGRYNGMIILKENMREYSVPDNRCFFTAEEKEGKIAGEYRSVSGEKRQAFTIGFEESVLCFTAGDCKETLSASGATGYFIAALDASGRKDWKTVRLEAQKVLIAGEFHLRKACELLNLVNESQKTGDVQKQGTIKQQE